MLDLVSLDNWVPSAFSHSGSSTAFIDHDIIDVIQVLETALKYCYLLINLLLNLLIWLHSSANLWWCVIILCLLLITTLVIILRIKIIVHLFNLVEQVWEVASALAVHWLLQWVWFTFVVAKVQLQVQGVAGPIAAPVLLIEEDLASLAGEVW